MNNIKTSESAQSLESLPKIQDPFYVSATKHKLPV